MPVRWAANTATATTRSFITTATTAAFFRNADLQVAMPDRQNRHRATSWLASTRGELRSPMAT
jgi:hypothetical protein